MANKIIHQNYQSASIIIQCNQNKNGGILLGDVNSFKDKKIMKFYKIKTIISCGKQTQTSALNTSSEEYSIIDIPISENEKQNIQKYFDMIYQIVQNAKLVGGILFTCFSGISRSPALLIAYLMRKRLVSYDQAYKQAKSKRSCIYPNEGFIRQLRGYEKQIKRLREQLKCKSKKLQITVAQQPQMKQLSQIKIQEPKYLLQSSIKKRSRPPVRGAALSILQSSEKQNETTNILEQLSLTGSCVEIQRYKQTDK